MNARRLAGVVSDVPRGQRVERPDEGESLESWARRYLAKERLESRSQRGNQLLRLIERVVFWPADRVSLFYDASHEAFAWIDDVLFKCVVDGVGEHLLVEVIDDGWHEVESAAALGVLMARGKLRGSGL